MKKYLLISILLFVFVACKTPVKLSDTTTTRVKDNTQISVEQRTETVEQNTTHTVVEASENSTIVEKIIVKEYDTSQSADTVTGKHPVKTETITRRTTTTGKQAKEQSLSTTSNAEKSELIDKTKKDVVIETTVTHEEIPTTPKIAYYFYIVLIVGIFVGLYVLNRKFKWLNKLLG